MWTSITLSIGVARDGLLPHVPRQHLARHEVILVPEQVLEKLELPRGQIEVRPRA